MKSVRILAAPRGDLRPGNPYLRLLYGGMRRFDVSVERFSFWRAITERYQATHIHWPEKLTRSTTKSILGIKFARLAVGLAAQRWRGGRVVWTCHNLNPHDDDSSLYRSLFRRCFLPYVTDVIYLTSVSRELSLRRYPELQGKRLAVIPHGHYRPVYPTSPDRRSARRTLAVPENAFVLLYFGKIRRYKQVPLLIDVFRKLDLPGVHLIVAGQPESAEMGKEIEANAAGSPRIHLQLAEVPENDVPTLFAAADLVVCPFREILNSGSVLLALSLDRPVLAPAVGSLPEVQNAVGKRWVSLYDDVFCPEVLDRAVKDVRDRPLQGRPDLSPYDWAPISEATYLQYLSDAERSDFQQPLPAVGTQFS